MAHSRPSLARTLPAIFLPLFFLLFAAVGPASAEVPFDVKSQMTDKAGVLGNDQTKVETALKDFTQKSGLKLFVVYVKSFDGTTGTAWAEETASKSGLGTTDILLAVSTSDNHYGVAGPRELTMSVQDFSAVAANDIRPAVNSSDWAGAAIDAARGYQQASADSRLPWAFILIVILAVILAGALIVRRTRTRYDDTHGIQDEHGQAVDPLELLDTGELVDEAQLSVAGVDDPTLKNELAKQLGDLLATDLKRTDDIRRSLAINIIRRTNKSANGANAGASSTGSARPSPLTGPPERRK